MYKIDETISFAGRKYKVISGTMYLDEEYILAVDNNDEEKIFKCSKELEEITDDYLLEQIDKYM